MALPAYYLALGNCRRPWPVIVLAGEKCAGLRDRAALEGIMAGLQLGLWLGYLGFLGCIGKGMRGRGIDLTR